MLLQLSVELNKQLGPKPAVHVLQVRDLPVNQGGREISRNCSGSYDHKLLEKFIKHKSDNSFNYLIVLSNFFLIVIYAG